MYAIIGGSGFARFAELTNTRRRVMRTPYGDPSGALTLGQLDGVEVCFLARHGYGHTLAPHAINYRANIWALREIGAENILAIAAVGGINPSLKPGDLVVPNQIIDYTHGRKSSFYEEAGQAVHHVDFTHPYDGRLTQLIERSAKQLKMPVSFGGVYGCTQGPRLETAAEIIRMSRDGCDLVGMTGMPEAVLAHELGIAYCSLAVVSNYAAGLADSAQGISLEAIGAVLDRSMANVRQLLSAAMRQTKPEI
jgi:5'-deoxy-5'-methylthioadenosine phosphorylase